MTEGYHGCLKGNICSHGTVRTVQEAKDLLEKSVPRRVWAYNFGRVEPEFADLKPYENLLFQMFRYHSKDDH